MSIDLSRFPRSALKYYKIQNASHLFQKWILGLEVFRTFSIKFIMGAVNTCLYRCARLVIFLPCFLLSFPLHFLFYFHYFSPRSRDSAVGIAIGYGLDDGGVGVRVPVGSRIFSSPRRPDRLRPTQPHIQWIPGALSSGVKRPGREADHSPPTSAEVKEIWIYTATPPYAFMA
jgi:hypothetical protein